MAFTHHPDPKPCSVGCRLKKEDYEKFDNLTRKAGQKQEILEQFVLNFIEENNIPDKSLLEHLHAKGQIHDYDFNTTERRELRSLENAGFVEVKAVDEFNKDFFWILTTKGAEVLK